MTPEQTRKLIDAFGSVRNFSIKLGLGEDDRALRRVTNWRLRGIPIAIQLHKRRELMRLEQFASRRGLL